MCSRSAAEPTFYRLVQTKQSVGIDLKQTFAEESMLLRFNMKRNVQARLFKRTCQVIKRQTNVFRRMAQEIEREASALSEAATPSLEDSLNKAESDTNPTRRQKYTSERFKQSPVHPLALDFMPCGPNRMQPEFAVKAGLAAGGWSFLRHLHSNHWQAIGLLPKMPLKLRNEMLSGPTARHRGELQLEMNRPEELNENSGYLQQSLMKPSKD